jgi:small-conductance mechanosensitive channel
MNDNDFDRRNLNFDKDRPNESIKNSKRSVLKKIIILGIILTISLVVSTSLLKSLIPTQYLMYFQVVQVAIVGYFIMEIIGDTAFNITTAAKQSNQSAKSIRSIIRILSAIVIAAILVSYVSQNPAIAASISTVSGIVIGFAAQNLIGNMIAGIYLAITRPFKMGDKITVFGNTGKVSDIGLLYCALLMEDGDTVRAPSSLLVTTSIILREEKKSNVYADWYIC